jgi:hypothetical protein
VTDKIETIYVALLDEGVDVWRPVRAEHVRADVYRIADQTYEAETERWEFVPGDLVRCGMVNTNEGEVLAATGPANATN